MWDPFTSNLVNVTELVQNNTATFITNNSTASVTFMKMSLGYPHLHPAAMSSGFPYLITLITTSDSPPTSRP